MFLIPLAPGDAPWVLFTIRSSLVCQDQCQMYTHTQAHRHRKKRLTGAAYVWILPQFYDPKWWKLNEQEMAQLRPSQRCSNYEMEEILNTTHVLSIGILHHQIPSLDSRGNQTVSIVRGNYVIITSSQLSVYTNYAYKLAAELLKPTFSKSLTVTSHCVVDLSTTKMQYRPL